MACASENENGRLPHGRVGQDVFGSISLSKATPPTPAASSAVWLWHAFRLARGAQVYGMAESLLYCQRGLIKPGSRS
jgi:hypothetical protein